MPIHDQLSKELLELFLGDLLQLVVPDLAPHLAAARAELLSPEVYADPPRGEHTRMDLVHRVPLLAPAEDALLVHVEIEAVARQGMGRRMLRYRHFLGRRHEERVLAIVLYLRGGPAGVEKRSVPEAVRHHPLETFHYWAFGLSRCDAAEYLAKDLPLAWALSVHMRRPDAWRPVEHKLRCLNRIGAASRLDPAQVAVLTNYVETYLVLSEAEHKEFEMLIHQDDNTAALDVKTTWFDKVRAQGREEGRIETLREVETSWFDKVRAQGREEGRIEALREIVLRQLGLRFGGVPADVRDRVESLGSEQELETLCERLLVAESLEALGLT